MTTHIHIGNCLTVLDTLPSESVNCVVTSPPYFGLRNYLDHPDQLGQEPTVAEYVANMVAVFAKLHRVLKKDGTAWLNLGDSYVTTGKKSNPEKDMGHNTLAYRANQPRNGAVDGFKEKNLLMIPARVAIALQDWGWYLRAEIIWHKTAAMPESVKDRPTKSHEMIYLLTKSPRYWYDHAAVREPLAQSTIEDTRNGKGKIESVDTKHAENDGSRSNLYGTKHFADPALGRNMRDVWSLAPAQFKGSHFATFPMEIPRRCILAGCPKGGTVLDPFGGAGTTALVAEQLWRDSILIELNTEYAEMARKRIMADSPMFNQVSIVGSPSEEKAA